MAQVFLDLITSFGNCLNCFPGSPSLKINSRNFKILRLLGEVGRLLLLFPPLTLWTSEPRAYGHVTLTGRLLLRLPRPRHIHL